MSNLREHLLTESSLLGTRNSSVPKSEVADAIDSAMEDVRWNLEIIKKTGGISKNHVKELSKTIDALRKLGDNIVGDLKSQEK
jgi:hypothetical protein